MKVYIENHQFIKAPLKNVFDFFSKPENLKEITPSKLNFKILTPTPISMNEGTMIDYTISFWYSFALKHSLQNLTHLISL